MFPPSLFILAMRSYNLMYRSHTKDDEPSCHSQEVNRWEVSSLLPGYESPIVLILFSFTCCGTGWITHHTHHWITSLTWGQGAIATRPHLLLNKRQGQSSMSHGGVKIKVQLAQRTENLAKQAAAEDESHPPSQGHRHMGPWWDLLFCSAITQLNYTSLLSCSHDDWILEPTEIISWTFVALAHERNLGLLQNLSSMTRQGLLETSTPKCSWAGGRAM